MSREKGESDELLALVLAWSRPSVTRSRPTMQPRFTDEGSATDAMPAPACIAFTSGQVCETDNAAPSSRPATTEVTAYMRSYVRNACPTTFSCQPALWVKRQVLCTTWWPCAQLHPRPTMPVAHTGRSRAQAHQYCKRACACTVSALSGSNALQSQSCVPRTSSKRARHAAPRAGAIVARLLARPFPLAAVHTGVSCQAWAVGWEFAARRRPSCAAMEHMRLRKHNSCKPRHLVLALCVTACMVHTDPVTMATIRCVP